MENEAFAESPPVPVPAVSPKPTRQCRQPFASLHNTGGGVLQQVAPDKPAVLPLARRSIDVSSLRALAAPRQHLTRSGSLSSVQTAARQGSAAAAIHRSQGQLPQAGDAAVRQSYAGMMQCSMTSMHLRHKKLACLLQRLAKVPVLTTEKRLCGLKKHSKCFLLVLC